MYDTLILQLQSESFRRLACNIIELRAQFTYSRHATEVMVYISNANVKLSHPYPAQSLLKYSTAHILTSC